MSILPIALIACAILVVSLSVVFVGIKVLGSGKTEVVKNIDEDDPPDDTPAKDAKPSPTPKTMSSVGSTTSDDTKITESPQSGNTKPANDFLKGRRYQDLSDPEKRQYLKERAMKIAQDHRQ